MTPLLGRQIHTNAAVSMCVCMFMCECVSVCV